MMKSVLAGTAAGAVGTVALNVATYGDMVARARPPSSTPSTLVKNVASAEGLHALAADTPEAENRRSGVGALLGYANGLGVGTAYGVLRPALRGRVPVLVGALLCGALAMALSDVPAARAKATDPKSWSPADWASDIVPHVVYGTALALSYEFFTEER